MTQEQKETRGRKRGGHNTKQKVIIGNAARQFNDPVQSSEFQCYKCGNIESKTFKYCPECGIENVWP